MTAEAIEVQEWMRDALRAGVDQSTCLRRRVAALALSPVLGSAKPSLAWNVIVNEEVCERCPLSQAEVASGSDYQADGQRCPALHAEEAAWFSALSDGLRPALMLVTEEPCDRCADLLNRVGVLVQVVTL